MTNPVYVEIAKKLAQHAGRVPRAGEDFSPAFLEYLELLYTPEEAELVQYLTPTREFYVSSVDSKDYKTVGEITELSGKDVTEVKRILDNLANSGRIQGSTEMNQELSKIIRILIQGSGFFGMLKKLFGIIRKKFHDGFKFGFRKTGGIIAVSMYALPIYPLLLNVHQFYESIEPDDLRAGELYNQFFIRDGYYKYYESSEQGTQTFRTIPVQRSLRVDQHILSTEEAHSIIDASKVEPVLVPCPCRTRTEKLGIRECKDRNPVGTCIMLGLSALYFQYHHGKKVSKQQAKDYLDEMQNYGLIATTENFEDQLHAIICLCCDCCCSMIRGRTRWDNPAAILPSNFIPQSNEDCAACGKCTTRCFFGALTLDPTLQKVEVDSTKCIGCGVCTITCPKKALRLVRFERSKPPKNAKDLYNRVDSENLAYLPQP